MVAGDRVVGEPAQQVVVAGGRRVLEAAHPQVAARHPREHGSRQQRVPVNLATRGHDGEGPGGGDAQRVHCLADDVLTQHRADRGQTVAAPRERRGARTLQVKVTNVPVQQCASVAQPGDEPAELVSGVRLRHRRGTVGHRDAHQEPQSVRDPQPGRVQTQVGGQPLVEHQ